MIEEYGTLSEEELVEEIKKQLEDKEGIDASDLEFKFVDDRLLITGTLQNEEELEVLVAILENYIDPKDYEMGVELIEAVDPDYEERRSVIHFDDDDDDDDDEEEILEEEEEEKILEEEDKGEGEEAEEGEEEAELEDEEDEGGFDDEKW